LRAVVAAGYIDGHRQPLAGIDRVVVEAINPKSPGRSVVRAATFLVATVGNGLKLSRIVNNILYGFAPDELREGPIDKRGAGSRILNHHGKVNEEELARLDQYAVDQVSASGESERGLGASQIDAMMKANYQRAKGSRRRVDRLLMQGEWPILLRVMGVPGANGEFLSLREIRTLFVSRSLPTRVLERLKVS
jgi:hypothetical protein